MKKIVKLFIVMILCFSFVGCQKKEKNGYTENKKTGECLW